MISTVSRGRVQPNGHGPVTKLSGVSALFHQPGWEPWVIDREAYLRVRTYDRGQYDVAFNISRARWQIVAWWEDKKRGRCLRLVRTWQDENGGYLPLSDRMHDYLVRTDFETSLGTRDGAKVARAIENQEADLKEKQERSVRDDIEHFKRDNRHVFNIIHSKWQKLGYDPRELVVR